jgi:hypothetical protein
MYFWLELNTLVGLLWDHSSNSRIWILKFVLFVKKGLCYYYYNPFGRVEAIFVTKALEQCDCWANELSHVRCVYHESTIHIQKSFFTKSQKKKVYLIPYPILTRSEAKCFIYSPSKVIKMLWRVVLIWSEVLWRVVLIWSEVYGVRF